MKKSPVAPDGAPARDRTDARMDLLLDAVRVAEKALEREARHHPAYPDVRQKLGLLRLAQGDCDAAASEFEEALSLNPAYRAAHYALRLSSLLKGRLSIPPLPAAAEEGTAPRDEALWACIDEAYRVLAGGGDPVAVLRAWEIREPLVFHHYAAAFSGRMGDASTQRRHWEAAGAMSPLTRSVLEAQGSGSQDGPQGLLWTPLAADLYGFLGRIHARHRMAEAATACYGWAYLVLPRESIYARHMAQLAIAEGEEGRAIALLTRAVAADPSDVEARMALGFEFAAQGFAEEARTHFEAAVALAPGFADLRYNLGLLYAAQGLGPKAMEQFRRALQINPSYIPARQSLAAAYCRAGQAEDGLREYERVLRQGFQSADMLAKMGQAALDLGRTEEALQYLERASFVNPDYAPSYYFLGQAYKAKGLRNKARAAWRRHLEKTDAWESATPWAPES